MLSKREKRTSSQTIPLVRASMLRPFVSAIQKTECDVDALLAEHGLALSLISLNDVFVPVQSWYDFVNQAAVQLDDPHFGYDVGHQTALASIPSLRTLKPHVATLGEIISHLIADAKQHATLGKWTLTIGNQWANFKLQRTFKPTSRPAQIDAFGFGFFRRIVENAVGQNWDASKFSSAISDPKAIPPSVAAAVQLARCSRDRASYIFPASWLFLHEEINDPAPAIREPETMLIAAFRQIVDAQSDKEDLTIRDAAKLCGRSVRALQRMLSAQGSSFRQEMNRFRQDRAQKLLTESNLSISCIAKTLGYSEAAGFSRAFKKRMGINPSDYRAIRRAQGRRAN